MKKLMVAAVVAMMAMSMVVVSPRSADARGWRGGGAVAGAIIGGLVLGGILASRHRHHSYGYYPRYRTYGYYPRYHTYAPARAGFYYYAPRRHHHRHHRHHRRWR